MVGGVLSDNPKPWSTFQRLDAATAPVSHDQCKSEMLASASRDAHVCLVRVQGQTWIINAKQVPCLH